MGQPATVREWTGLLHHLRLNAGEHHVGLTLASYADSDGSRVFPGVDRLAVVTGLSRRGVMRHLDRLRALGLLDRVRAGHRRGRADEYQLVIPDDLPDDMMRSPAELELDVEKSRGANRRAYQPRHVRDTDDTYMPVDNPVETDVVRDTDDTYTGPESESVRATHDTNSPVYVPMATRVRVTGGTPPSHYLDTTTTYHSEEDLHTAVTVPSEPVQDPEIAEEDQPPPVDPPDDPPTHPDRVVGRATVPRPDRCPHRLPDRDRGDGWSSCNLCRREAGREPTGVFPVVKLLADVIPIRRPA